MFNFTPDENWEDMLPLRCDKCDRWYNPTTQHICAPDPPDVERGRRKLQKWLGNGAEIQEP